MTNQSPRLHLDLKSQKSKKNWKSCSAESIQQHFRQVCMDHYQSEVDFSLKFYFWNCFSVVQSNKNKPSSKASTPARSQPQDSKIIFQAKSYFWQIIYPVKANAKLTPSISHASNKQGTRTDEPGPVVYSTAWFQPTYAPTGNFRQNLKISQK